MQKNGTGYNWSKAFELTSKISKKGMGPGSLIHVGQKWQDETSLYLYSYDAEHFVEKKLDPYEAPAAPAADQVNWLMASGLSDVEGLSRIGENRLPDDLILEDILNTFHRAKLEKVAHGVLFVSRILQADDQAQLIRSEQLSVWFDSDGIISFQERPSSFFEPIINRLREGNGKIRKRKHDYLFCAITDLLVDEYLDVAVKIQLKLDQIERNIAEKSNYDPSAELHQMRKVHMEIKQIAGPVREEFSRLIKDHDGLIQSNSLRYFSDVIDHLAHLNSVLEQIHNSIIGLREMYASKMNLSMNKVIQLLTLITTIFIPLTLITGIFGMNFTSIPGLDWPYGFLATMIGLILIGGGLFALFRMRKWL